MLLFLGGAARTGKSILARRLLAKFGLPYLSLDVLKMGLTRGMPELTLDPNAGAPAVAARLWPIVREMSRSLLYDRTNYVYEGELLPEFVADLQSRYAAQVHACFLGYATIDPAQKLHEIRTYTGHPNDWSLEYNDAELLPIILREIAFSQHVRAECARYQLPYFETSEQFLAAHAAVMEYVEGQLHQA
jgi:putative acetyltransferase